MDALDFLLLPIYFGLFYLIGSSIAQRNNNNKFYRLYYMRGLRYKMLGSIGFALIYVFYYKGGDSINFFVVIRPLFKLFFSNPSSFFSFVFSYNAQYPGEAFWEAAQTAAFYLLRGTPSLTVIKVGAFFDVLCLNSFFSLCLCFAFISYQFQFKAFALIASIYPTVHKRLAQAFIMIPSVIFWSSGLGKDSIMFGSIMMLFYSYYKLVIKRENFVKYLILTLLVGFLISLIRAFILFTVVPCLLIMTVTYYRNAIGSSVLRFLIGPFFILAGVGGSIVFVRGIGSEVQSYSIESLQKKAEGFQSWHTYLGKTEGGSSYSLGGSVEYTAGGVVKQAPVALIYSLFGPFIWQVRNPIMLLSAGESLILLYFTFIMLRNRRIYSLFGILVGDHIITFCIPFSIILGIAIGLTSFNFGALVRYRIPILPFFATALIIINYHLNQSKSVRV
jgi:hypothetical protein